MLLLLGSGERINLVQIMVYGQGGVRLVLVL